MPKDNVSAKSPAESCWMSVLPSGTSSGGIFLNWRRRWVMVWAVEIKYQITGFKNSRYNWDAIDLLLQNHWLFRSLLHTAVLLLLLINLLAKGSAYNSWFSPCSTYWYGPHHWPGRLEHSESGRWLHSDVVIPGYRSSVMVGIVSWLAP